ncbi:hypothetical protein A3709_19280 [Halioglobus sp. HI00S01]|uniref:hypothetical protein n=1 Tax=Halioglobus sp. HI00S01 TaxID=1822214 RepID=UPI0007C280A5|nr:hypothetical protein [Halioglobus sp. HI00S01]KZX57767.1 hypothetical protein A3709_19280 [Halioglobus sp. HI00S01]
MEQIKNFLEALPSYTTVFDPAYSHYATPETLSEMNALFEFTGRMCFGGEDINAISGRYYGRPIDG